MKKKLLFYLITIFICSFARNEEDKVVQLKIGNFALPTSQQPGPLIGFGQNIIDKGDFQVFAYFDELKGKKKKFIEIAPSILYAFSDKLSIFIETSYAIKFKIDNNSSNGIEDSLVQLEYAFFNKEQITSVDQATIVVNITLPTGSAFKKPPTGFGAPGFFLGFTASHMATDWYYFASTAVILTTEHKNTKFGNQFLYQCGLSRNISYKPDKWIFNWMIELDGLYRARNKLLGKIDENSGGNMIILGPSLWFSTQRLIIQAGISAVISEHLFGNQTKDKYFAAINIGWKF